MIAMGTRGVIAAHLTGLIFRKKGEKVWRLPLESEYMEQLKSPIADMHNTGGRLGGAKTLLYFLLVAIAARGA